MNGKAAQDMHEKSRNIRPTIGLFISNLNDVQSREVWAGALTAAKKEDVNLLCFPVRWMQTDWYDNPHPRDVLLELASAENIDGLISFNWWADRQSFERFYKQYRPLPVVNVIRLYEGYPGVAWDNHTIIRTLVEHLVTVHNCRRIAYLGPVEGTGTPEERYQSYRDTLAAHSIAFDPALVMPWSDGVRGIRFLIDEQELRPGSDFEAIVSYNDDMALAAMGELQARGINVPADVAVVGIDDVAQSRVAVPPLTTLAMPRVAMGQRAVEMLVARLRGEPIPERVILSPKLKVRRSCGCMTQSVQLAGAQPAQTEDRQAVQRDEMLKAMVDAMVGVAGDEATRAAYISKAEQLVDSFRDGSFLSLWDRVLGQTIRADDWDSISDDVRCWQDVLSVMYRYLESAFDSVEAETLWQQARVMTGEAIGQAERRQRLLAAQRNRTLRETGQALITAFDLEEMPHVLAENLPHLNIPGCFLALYEDPKEPAAGAWLLLAYRDGQCIDLGPGGQRFSSRQLIPEGMLSQEHGTSLVVEALYFHQEQIGFVLFEVGPREGAGKVPPMVYEALQGQISSSLKGALLLDERKRAEEALERAYADVEQQVAERTAELQQEIAERERVQEKSAQLQQQIIDAQQQALQELSTPVIPVMEHILVMPLIGSIDTMRARDIMRALLQGISEHRAKYVILDVTGVPVMDTGIVNHLNKTIQAARLKGAHTIVTGISDAVAEAVVDLGVDWRAVETLADLHTGLRVALDRMNVQL
jgi:DNA-binding LacI/PurR family transcriptional regulator/anti-anti-sigma regulatory factor